MATPTLLVGVFAFWILIAVTPVTAYQTYMEKIPNGGHVKRNSVDWPGVGHNSSQGGGIRNDFGTAFAAANYTWTKELCQADTDKDGFSNGQELGDPDCVWTLGATPARTTDISHPAYADSYPVTGSQNTTAPSSSSAICTAQNNGTTFQSSEGVIKSDTDGSGSSTYDHNENCEWTILCSGSSVIGVSLTLSIDSADKLILVDSSNQELLSKSGDHTVVQNFTTSSILVQFSSAASGTLGSGFTLNYQCGGIASPSSTPGPSQSSSTCSASNNGARFAEQQGVIKSDADGAGGDKYNHNENCEWFIMCPSAQSHLSIDLTLDTGDAMDKVVLLSSHGGEVLSESGNQHITKRLSFSALTVKFTSGDTNVNGTGFTLMYTCVAAGMTPTQSIMVMEMATVTATLPAGGDTTPTSSPPASKSVCTAQSNGTTFQNSEGIIMSDTDGSGSDEFSPHEDCEWTVMCRSASDNIGVALILNIGASDKLMLLNNESAELLSESGSHHIMKNFTVSTLMVRFTSGDSTVNGTGFTLTYTCHADNGETQPPSTTIGGGGNETVQPPPPTVTDVPPTNNVHTETVVVDTSAAPEDTTGVVNATTPEPTTAEPAATTGTPEPPVDTPVPGSTPVPPGPKVCSSPNGNNTVFTAETSTIRSDADGEGNANTYQHNEHCQWAINCPATTSAISVTIDLKTTGSMDRLAFFSTNSVELFSMWGSKTNQTRSVVGAKAGITFTTDNSGALGDGFTLSYMCVVPTAQQVEASRTALNDGSATTVDELARASGDVLTSGQGSDKKLVLEALEKTTTSASAAISNEDKKEIISLVSQTTSSVGVDSSCNADCVSTMRAKTAQIAKKLAQIPVGGSNGATALSENEAKGLVVAVGAFEADVSTTESVEAIAVSMAVASSASDGKKVIATDRYNVAVQKFDIQAQQELGTNTQNIAVGGTVVELPASSDLKTKATKSGTTSSPSLAVVESATNVFGTAGIAETTQNKKEGSTLAIESAVVDVRFNDDFGNPVSIGQLSEPIKISIPVKATAVADLKATPTSTKAVCNYLDTSTGMWSASGVSFVKFDEQTSTVQCSTVHLTKFGVSVGRGLTNDSTGDNGGNSGGSGSSDDDSTTKSSLAFIFMGAIVAVVTVAGFLYFNGKKKREQAAAELNRQYEQELQLQVPMMHGGPGPGMPSQKQPAAYPPAAPNAGGGYNPYSNQSSSPPQFPGGHGPNPLLQQQHHGAYR